MTKLLVTHTGHFVRGPNGNVHARETLLGRTFWSRYFSVFDVVRVAARVRTVPHVPSELPRSDGDGVEFVDLPDYVGPWQYLLCRRAIRARLREALAHCDVFCLRVPCPIATILWEELRRSGRHFGVEVVGDPWNALAPGGVRSILRPFARWAAAHDLRAQCLEAAAAYYVTERFLQGRYPPGPQAHQVGFSDIDLPESAIVDGPRTQFRVNTHLIIVGTLAVLYKGPDVLLHALACIGRSDLHLTIVGDGRKRGELEALARTLGIEHQVTFVGHVLAGAPVREWLDRADLFVLPSRTEGLPRAVIEAMARGLPIIATSVGGLPELLAPEDLVPPDDPDALALKILEFVNDPTRQATASRRNLERARAFRAPLLEQQRTAFYAELLRRSRR